MLTINCIQVSYDSNLRLYMMLRLQDSIEVDPSGLRLTYKDDIEEWCTLIGDADLDECRAVCCATATMRLQAS